MNDEMFERLKAASALIRAGKSHGTGYLVAPDLLATCAHVVGNETTANIDFEFVDVQRTATLAKIDKENDCASLRLNKPVDIAPLEFAATCPRKSLWEGYGYVMLMRGHAISLDGVITDSNGRDDKGVRSIVMTSPQVGAGMGAPLHGFSGSPVVVAGKLVGHMKRLLGDPENPTRPTLGIVFATPSSAVLDLLGMQAPESVSPEVPLMANSLPKVGPDEYHAIVSYRSTDRDWAKQCIARFEGAGFRIFSDENEVAESGEVPVLPKARSGVVIISSSWLESEACRIKSARLFAQHKTDGTFRLIALRIDGTALPSDWNDRNRFDFTDGKLPEGARLCELCYTLLGQNRTALTAATKKLDQAEVEVTDHMLSELRLANSAGPSRIIKLWKQWKTMGIAQGPASWMAAQYLIGHGRPEAALDILSEDAKGTRERQLRALALGKMCRIDEAIVMLKQLEDEGQLDAETGGLLGGRYKQKWQQTGQSLWLRSALRVYRDTYGRTGDTFVGINAATLALFAGNEADATKTARQVIERLEMPDLQTDYWPHATRGEAYLLLNNLDRAIEAYDQAVSWPAPYQDIAVMRHQARLILEKMGQDRNALDDVLQIPGVIAYSGHMVDAQDRKEPRFPPERVGTVRLAIRAWLKAHHVGFAFGSAANGTDLLVLDEVIARGGSGRVYLPFPRDRFLQTSVGTEWKSDYDRLLDHERVEVYVLDTVPPTPDREPQAYYSCNLAFQQAAANFASQLDEEPVMLTVWNGNPGDGQGGTADAVRAWQNLGLRRFENIDISRS